MHVCASSLSGSGFTHKLQADKKHLELVLSESMRQSEWLVKHELSFLTAHEKI